MAHSRRGTQVVRERSAKPLCVGSIPTRASKFPIGYKPSNPEGFFFVESMRKRSAICLRLPKIPRRKA
jgi:hypothetical protein